MLVCTFLTCGLLMSNIFKKKKVRRLCNLATIWQHFSLLRGIKTLLYIIKQCEMCFCAKNTNMHVILGANTSNTIRNHLQHHAEHLLATT